MTGSSETAQRETPHDFPEQQFISPDLVLLEMAEVNAKRASEMTSAKVLVLSMLAGSFIVVGALFSVFLGAGVEAEGPKVLLEGFGFSVGFFLVIMTGALLFTEINVETPATFLGLYRQHRGFLGLVPPLLRLWGLAAFGNLAGAFVIGWVIQYAHDLAPVQRELLLEIAEGKLRYERVGGAEGFFQAIVSGILGNWLVGMAAFLSIMGRTIVGRFVPVFVIVTAFVSFGFLHSPANMAFFSLYGLTGEATPWADAFTWSILPAAIGNIIGAFVLVALPFWFAGTRGHHGEKAESHG